MSTETLLGPEAWMARALELAAEAELIGEVPVGAVVLDPDGVEIGAGYNRPIRETDGTAHAEIVALRDAFSRTGNYRLPGCSLYTTVEPCLMCAGAIFHARIANLYYGATDEKFGAFGGAIDLSLNKRLNHHAQVVGGICADKAAESLAAFFRSKR